MSNSNKQAALVMFMVVVLVLVAHAVGQQKRIIDFASERLAEEEKCLSNIDALEEKLFKDLTGNSPETFRHAAALRLVELEEERTKCLPFRENKRVIDYASERFAEEQKCLRVIDALEKKLFKDLTGNSPETVRIAAASRIIGLEEERAECLAFTSNGFGNFN